MRTIDRARSVFTRFTTSIALVAASLLVGIPESTQAMLLVEAEDGTLVRADVQECPDSTGVLWSQGKALGFMYVDGAYLNTDLWGSHFGGGFVVYDYATWFNAKGESLVSWAYVDPFNGLAKYAVPEDSNYREFLLGCGVGAGVMCPVVDNPVEYEDIGVVQTGNPFVPEMYRVLNW